MDPSKQFSQAYVDWCEKSLATRVAELSQLNGDAAREATVWNETKANRVAVLKRQIAQLEGSIARSKSKK